MADTETSIFVSYSRKDSDFVDRLDADLTARGYRVWVDRRKLEGSDVWFDELEKAINGAHVVLAVLSPDSVGSKWVKRELSYADGRNKRIVPLLARPVTQVPLLLNDMQWIDFGSNHDQGMQQLLLTLRPLTTSATAAKAPPQLAPAPPKRAASDPLELVASHPAPPPPAPDLDALYRASIETKTAGDIEQTLLYWQQIQQRDQSFAGGIIAPQLPTLEKQVRDLRVKRVRDQANTAIVAKDWRRATGAWRALLDFAPEDEEAKVRLLYALWQRAYQARREADWGEEIGTWEAISSLLDKPGYSNLLKTYDENYHMLRYIGNVDQIASQKLAAASQNQRWAFQYQVARDFLTAGKQSAAREALSTLWKNAPHYGDPEQLARKVEMRVTSRMDDPTTDDVSENDSLRLLRHHHVVVYQHVRDVVKGRNGYIRKKELEAKKQLASLAELRELEELMPPDECWNKREWLRAEEARLSRRRLFGLF